MTDAPLPDDDRVNEEKYRVGLCDQHLRPHRRNRWCRNFYYFGEKPVTDEGEKGSL